MNSRHKSHLQIEPWHISGTCICILVLRWLNEKGMGDWSNPLRYSFCRSDTGDILTISYVWTTWKLNVIHVYHILYMLVHTWWYNSEYHFQLCPPDFYCEDSTPPLTKCVPCKHACDPQIIAPALLEQTCEFLCPGYLVRKQTAEAAKETSHRLLKTVVPAVVVSVLVLGVAVAVAVTCWKRARRRKTSSE